jgi:hypothetical protein
MLSPLLAIAPQPGFHHPQPQRFSTHCNPANLAQLLGREGRAKIPIPFTNDYQHRSPQRCGLASVAAATSSF